MEKRNIIVIGASTGGFEACKKIVRGLPPDLNASIFIVWHMSPAVRGVLPDVLNKENTIYAAHAYEMEPIMPNRIYLAPPDHHLLIEEDRVRVTRGPKENRFRPAVDPLFRSAAYTYGNRVIGVVLSGALDDGTAGLWRIKFNGGITVVQDPDEWFNQINGRHRIVFDVTHPDEIMPFVGPRIFLATNAATGTPAKDCSIVVVLRHKAIPFAFDSNVWEKYKFGDKFKFDDPASHVASVRNPFWKPAKGDFVIPGIGDAAIGINQLQADGVMFCVCDSAINLQSYIAAASMKMDAGEIKKEWMTALLPGIMVVPSGLWAVDRAQEHKCSYCFVG